MSKITNGGLTRSGTGCFIAVRIWQRQFRWYTVRVIRDESPSSTRWLVSYDSYFYAPHMATVGVKGLTNTGYKIHIRHALVACRTRLLQGAKLAVYVTHEPTLSPLYYR